MEGVCIRFQVTLCGLWRSRVCAYFSPSSCSCLYDCWIVSSWQTMSVVFVSVSVSLVVFVSVSVSLRLSLSLCLPLSLPPSFPPSLLPPSSLPSPSLSFSPSLYHTTVYWGRRCWGCGLRMLTKQTWTLLTSTTQAPPLSRETTLVASNSSPNSPLQRNLWVYGCPRLLT